MKIYCSTKSEINGGVLLYSVADPGGVLWVLKHAHLNKEIARVTPFSIGTLWSSVNLTPGVLSGLVLKFLINTGVD